MLIADISSCGLVGKRVLCAVSGGADSVALLCLLNEARRQGQLTLFAAHFEHGIRGEDSVNDMRFVKDLCKTLDVPLSVGRGNVPREAIKAGEGLEACARRLRHEFLENTRQRLDCDFIAVAHHQRDRAETVLMHLLRGGGLKGAAAMPMVAGRIVRPLINFSPEEIVGYLKENNIPWREDATNQIDDNPRNALRLNVFPLLKDIYPGFERALCRFSEISISENAYIERETDAYIEQNLTNFAGVWALKRGDVALTRRAILRLLPEGSFEDVEVCMSALKPTDIGGGVSVTGDRDTIYITPGLSVPKAVRLNFEGETELKDVCRVSAESCPSVPKKDNGLTQVLNLNALKGAHLRLRRHGDFIRPFGLKGKSKTIGDYFTDRHYPLAFRSRVPVIAVKNEIMWVPGLGISESARVDKSTPAVKLTINIFGGEANA